MTVLDARGANLNRLGDFNESVVLHAIRRSTGISRVELGELTGLAAQTVTNICRRLLDQGLIVEGDKARAARGKPRVLLRVNGPARCAIGVHVDPAVTTITMMDLAGNTVATQRFRTPSPLDPDHVVHAVADAVNDMVSTQERGRELVVGVGVAVPGPVDLSRGEVVDPPHLPSWHHVPLRERLAAATGLPVVMDKDVIAAATAEKWAGTLSDAATSAIIYLGTGIGAGLVVDGRIVRGVSDNAGEMRHIVVDPDGPPCVCGQRGCVNVTITSEALMAQARRRRVFRGSPGTPTLDDLYDLAAAGRRPALEVVQDAAAGVARAVLVITNLLDVDRVILGGPYWPRIEPYVMECAPALLEASAAAHRIHPVELVGTRLGDRLASVGAASMVLDRAFSPHPARLVLHP
jgi:predicted NBD/HSP70 family sugar kinase